MRESVKTQFVFHANHQKKYPKIKSKENENIL